MSDFRVSVVIPLHNKAPFIRRTLESALAQTHAAGEILIVDDSSTDDSIGAIRDLVGGRVRLIVQPNAGPGPARNRAIAEASQPWIAFLDGDDLWRPDHLATLADLSRQFPQAGLLASGYDFARSDVSIEPGATDGSATRGDLIDYFNIPLERPAIWTSCVAARRSAIQAAGGFGAFCPGEDRELWVRLALDHVFAVGTKRTAIYVKDTGGLMDSFEDQPIGFYLPPVYATIERALDDPRHAAQHGALRGFQRRMLAQTVKQALYRGEATAARAYIREIEKSGPARLGFLRALSLLPAPILRAGMTARARLRNPTRHA